MNVMRSTYQRTIGNCKTEAARRRVRRVSKLGDCRVTGAKLGAEIGLHPVLLAATAVLDAATPEEEDPALL
jgi:hypothetical protein